MIHVPFVHKKEERRRLILRSICLICARFRRCRWSNMSILIFIWIQIGTIGYFADDFFIRCITQRRQCFITKPVDIQLIKNHRIAVMSMWWIVQRRAANLLHRFYDQHHDPWCIWNLRVSHEYGQYVYQYQDSSLALWLTHTGERHSLRLRFGWLPLDWVFSFFYSSRTKLVFFLNLIYLI